MANLPILPRELPNAVTPLEPTDVFIVDQGGGALVSKVTAAPIVDSVAPLATETDAQIGTDNVKRMSPLRTKQAIASEVGVTVASYAAGQAGLSAVQSVNGKTGNAVVINKSDVGLGNVSNLSPADLPISTATQSALNLKANANIFITGDNGLTGGGTLTESRSISLNESSVASLLLADTAVQPAITIAAGAGLTGGGTLAANRTIALSTTSIASLDKADTAVQPAVLNDYATLTQLATKFDNPTGNTSQYLRGDGSLATFPAIPQGTITSVGLVAPVGFTVSNSPVTISGNLTLGYTSGYQGFTSAESTKLAGIASGAQVNTVTSVAGRQGAVVLTKADVGLSEVSNLAPADLPVSSATQTALNAKANSAITITAGAGLTGGGNLTANRSVALSAASIASLAKADSATQPSDLGALATKDKVSIPDINATGAANNGSFLRGDGTWSPVAGAGTVTSVAMTVPIGLSIAGSPITGAGTLAVTYTSGFQGYTTTEANKLAGIASGAQVNVPQVQTDWNATTGLGSILNKPTLGTAAAQNSTAFATAAQGSKADTALQTLTEGANITITGTGTSRTIAATVPAAPVTSVAGKTGAVTLVKADVGLGNVDNTSDANKPVSTAQQAALNGKLNADAQAVDSARLGNKTAAAWQAEVDAKAGVYAGSNADELNYPIGKILSCFAAAGTEASIPILNANVIPRLDAGKKFVSNGGSGAVLTGIWICTGQTLISNTRFGFQIQRVG